MYLAGSDYVQMLWISMVFVMGLCLGSFLTMAGYRLAQHSGSWLAPSRCPHCQQRLRIRSLIPVISWLWQRGRCLHCQAKIAIYYPVVELLTAGICVLNYYYFGFSGAGIMLQLISLQLLLLAIVDWYSYTFPDLLQLSLWGCCLVLMGMVVGNDWRFWGMNLLSGGVQIAVGILLRYGLMRLLKKDPLGFGDIKFFGIAGCVLGFTGIVEFYFLAGFFGVIFALGWQHYQHSSYFPFGPALVGAFYLSLVFPNLVNDILLGMLAPWL